MAATLGTSIAAAEVDNDVLDFAQLADSMTLDANLAVSASGSNYSINFDSDTLAIDTANDRVGVGTSSPGAKLAISDSAAQTVLTLNSSAGGGTYTQILSSGTSKGYFGYISTGTAGIGFLNAAGTSHRFLFTDDGASVLHATSTTAIAMNFQNSSSSHGYIQYTGSDMRLYSGSNSIPTIAMSGGAPGLVGVGGDTSPDASLEVVNDGSGDSFLVADTNDGDASPFVIDADGDVGIGTASPGNLLDISNNSSDTANNAIRLTNNNTGGSAGSGILLRHYVPGATAITSIGRIYTASDDGSLYTKQRMTFQVNSGASLADLMTLKNGQVGIGTTIPTATLDVRGASGTELNALNLFNSASTANELTTILFADTAFPNATSAIKHKLNSGGSSTELQFFTATGSVSAQRVAISSIGNVTLATGQLDAGTAGDGLVTEVVAGACSDSSFTTDTNGLICIDSTNGRIYYRYGDAWHYSAQTAGFQIPNLVTDGRNETEGLQVGDYVIGKLNQRLNDGALHGLYVKFDLATEIANVLALHPELLTHLTHPSTSSGSPLSLVRRGDGGEVIFPDGLIIEGDVRVAGALTRGNERTGKATIPAGGTEVKVTFAKPFSITPGVTITPESEPDSLWWVAEKTKNGFTIRLKSQASNDVAFTWVAVAIPAEEDVRGSVAEVNDEREAPEEATPTPEAEITVAEPEPSLEPSPTPTPTESEGL